MTTKQTIGLVLGLVVGYYIYDYYRYKKSAESITSLGGETDKIDDISPVDTYQDAVKKDLIYV